MVISNAQTVALIRKYLLLSLGRIISIPAFRCLSNMKLSEKPIVFVLGPTASNKSRLSIDLATKFNGEIISADSMQVYVNLDIITNKVVDSEMKGIPHHLINFVDPLTPFTVVDYRNKALAIIEDVLMRDKLPIITGGTMYWVESLLYEVLIPSFCENDIALKTKLDVHDDFLGENFQWREDELTQEVLFSHPIEPKYLRNVASEELHKYLEKVDPSMAKILHPAVKRKIIRSLQVYQQTGKPHSYWVKLQKNSTGGSKLGGPLRLKNSIILLLTCDKLDLRDRINDRVDLMIERGLINELLEFHEKYHNSKYITDPEQKFTEGIFQNIGFKEFHPYLILNYEQRSSPKGEALFKSCLEHMKTATRKYAKTQIKWIRNRLLTAEGRQVPKIFELDCSNLEQWPELIKKAEHIVDSHINSHPLDADIKPLERGTVPAHMEPHVFR